VKINIQKSSLLKDSETDNALHTNHQIPLKRVSNLYFLVEFSTNFNQLMCITLGIVFGNIQVPDTLKDKRII
jgi:hypothetical protein